MKRNCIYEDENTKIEIDQDLINMVFINTQGLFFISNELMERCLDIVIGILKKNKVFFEKKVVSSDCIPVVVAGPQTFINDFEIFEESFNKIELLLNTQVTSGIWTTKEYFKNRSHLITWFLTNDKELIENSIDGFAITNIGGKCIVLLFSLYGPLYKNEEEENFEES